MNYGLAISASGALTSLHQQDVLTNNLANINTRGFKPAFAETLQRDPARVEDSLYQLPSNRLLEQLGGGLLVAPSRTSFRQGTLERTGNQLDLAIEGPGFFVVRDSGDDQSQTLRFTRDGRFTRNDQGNLVMATEGFEVLGVNNRPIAVPPAARIDIDELGVIRADGLPVARIQVTDVPDPGMLDRHGNGLFAASPEVLSSRHQAAGLVKQHHLEEAAVDEIDAMMAITGASRRVEANIGMITYHDRLMERAINTLGRVA